jgi:hypothetical protein
MNKTFLQYIPPSGLEGSYKTDKHTIRLPEYMYAYTVVHGIGLV